MKIKRLSIPLCITLALAVFTPSTFAQSSKSTQAQQSSLKRDIVEAVEKGDLLAVQQLVSLGADINSTNYFGTTLLILAIGNDEIAIVKYLLEQGANPEAKIYENTALMVASSKGSQKMVQMLLAKGADIKGNTSTGYSVLMTAAERGHYDLTSFLIDQSTNLNESLWAASTIGREEVIASLISKGANINSKDKYYQRTALMMAAEYGHLETLKNLVNQGANIEVKDKMNNTALLLAAENGHLDIVQFLIFAGADINHKNGYEQTAFTQSTLNGHLKVAKYLAQEGIEVNIQFLNLYKSLGNSILEWIVDANQMPLETYLSRRKLTHQEKNEFILWASRHGHLEIVKYLVNSGANINYKSRYGETALKEAIDYKHLDIINFLLKNGANKNLLPPSLKEEIAKISTRDYQFMKIK